MKPSDFDRTFAPLLAPFAPPQSEVHRFTEAQRIAADVAYNEYKASGQLRRDEDHRALVDQIKFGDVL